jgi:acyl-CoA synthetase (AMP-forming)/AMP-acid ligase II
VGTRIGTRFRSKGRARKESLPSVVDRFRSAAHDHPRRLALRADDGTLTFAELETAADAAAVDLAGRGAGEGSHVVLLLPNSVAFAALTFGALSLGAVVVPLEPRWGRRELAHVLDEIDPEVIVIEKGRQPAALTQLLAEGGRARRLSGRCMYVDEMTATEWSSRAAAKQPVRQIAPDATAGIFYTSGASGTPKAVVHTHRSLSAGADALKARHRDFFHGSPLAVLQRTSTLVVRYRRRVVRSLVAPQVWLTPISFHAIAGFSLLMQCMLTGQALVTERRFHPRHTLRFVQDHRVTTMALTPTLADVIMRLRGAGDYDISSLLVVGLGGSLAPPALVERMREFFGCAIAVGYGSTELAGGVLSTDLLDPLAAQASTVGRPFPGAEVRVVGDDGVDVPTGEPGELLCRTPGLMAGYLDGNSDHATGIDRDGWYHTGDLAFLDDDGRVHVLGRHDDVIVRAGKKVHPTEVEHCILERPDVAEVAVVGTEPDGGEQRVVAFVVGNDGATMNPAEVIRHCRGRIEAHKVPVAVATVASLPRTPEGKIQRYRLRGDATKLLATEQLGTP